MEPETRTCAIFVSEFMAGLELFRVKNYRAIMKCVPVNRSVVVVIVYYCGFVRLSDFVAIVYFTQCVAL